MARVIAYAVVIVVGIFLYRWSLWVFLLYGLLASILLGTFSKNVEDREQSRRMLLRLVRVAIRVAAFALPLLVAWGTYRLAGNWSDAIWIRVLAAVGAVAAIGVVQLLLVFVLASILGLRPLGTTRAAGRNREELIATWERHFGTDHDDQGEATGC